jgi:signal transduction histidine kinase
MTTETGNREKNGRDAGERSRMVSIYSYGAGILIILFMGNLSALIDAAIHPDIEYFNEEHLIVGGVTTFVTSVLFIIVTDFFSRLRRKENELQKLNAELEKKVAERTRQLVESQGKLLQEEKLAMLGRIAGNMGNELRNPLGVMSNAAFFLQTVLPDADETVSEYLEIIVKEIDNSRSIISDLTDYCSGSRPRTKPVSALELIRQSRDKCTIPENISFQADLPATLPQVQVDPLQMGQVFRELITNAVQAMPNGGSVRVSAQQVRGTRNEERENNEIALEPRTPIPDPGFIEISISDSGEGIAAENMEKLFQPLFSTRSRGIGLGLAIAQKLTEANGGRIEVESALGKGTTFVVTLPVMSVGRARREAP